MITSSILKYPNLFSDRTGGVSTGIYSSMNLGWNLGDDPGSVRKNWSILMDRIGASNVSFARQVHGNEVRIVRREDAVSLDEMMSLSDPMDHLPHVDGLVTDCPGLMIGVFTADCVPVLLEDPDAGVVAAIHCGWRSTVADIEKNALTAMCSLGADPSKIQMSVGPCIHACCFETGPEVVEAIRKLVGDSDANGLFRPEPGHPDHYLVDLPKTICTRFSQLGISDSHMEVLDFCTMCSQDRFWSHRCLGLKRGSSFSAIMIPE